MLRVTTRSGAGCFIDATEVTVEAYAKFLQAAPKPSSVPAVCANSNPSYIPLRLDPPRPRQPVSNVDWCDAATFCGERGKHLCGRVGERAPLAGPDLQDPVKSEWLNACAGPSNQAYPDPAIGFRCCS